MAVFLQHVAINTTHFEESVQFFESLFEMKATRMMGDAPNRKIWFRQGIQVNEVSGQITDGNQFDHLGFQVTNWQETRRKATAMGCKDVEGKPHWFVTPDGIVIELKE